jgi:hypothetical protein
MNFLTLNSALNGIISEWLEGGGCPARCAEVLRQIAQEVDATKDEPLVLIDEDIQVSWTDKAFGSSDD